MYLSTVLRWLARAPGVINEKVMSNKHVIIGGGSGFIGSVLSEFLKLRGDKVTIISRYPGANRITWQELKDKGLPACDAVVNLAGKHILDPKRRWNDKYREEVIASRVETTEALVNAINQSETLPEVFISTAGKCFYGTQELNDKQDYPELDELSEPMGIDFPAELVGLWEAAANNIDSSKIRHVKLRIGVVLGGIERKSHIGKLWRIGSARGFLPIIRLPFCLGLGAVIGNGRQPFPWIHIEDMVNLIIQSIDDKSMHGKYNGVSPGIVTNREFTEVFARKLRRPIVWSVPSSVIEFIVGKERSSILLQGQLVKPRRTLESGFEFKFPDIDSALSDLTKILF